MPNDLTPVLEATIPPSRAMPEARSGFDDCESSLDHWLQTQFVLLSRTIEIAKTTHAFTKSRLRTNLDTCRSLMSCQDPAGLIGLRREYVENATVQHRDHARVLSKQIQHWVGYVTPSGIDGDKL